MDSVPNTATSGTAQNDHVPHQLSEPVASSLPATDPPAPTPFHLSSVVYERRRPDSLIPSPKLFGVPSPPALPPTLTQQPARKPRNPFRDDEDDTDGVQANASLASTVPRAETTQRRTRKPCNPFIDLDDSDDSMPDAQPVVASPTVVDSPTTISEGQIRAEYLRAFLELATKLDIRNLGDMELTSERLGDCLNALGSPDEKATSRRVLELYFFAKKARNELKEDQKQRLASPVVQELVVEGATASLMENIPWKSYGEATKTLLSIMLWHLDPGNASRSASYRSTSYKPGLEWLKLASAKPPPTPPRMPRVIAPVPAEDPRILARRRNVNTIELVRRLKDYVGVNIVDLNSIYFTDDEFDRATRDNSPLRLRDERNLRYDANRYARSSVVEVYRTAIRVFHGPRFQDVLEASESAIQSCPRSAAVQLKNWLIELTVDDIMAGDLKSLWQPIEANRQTAEKMVPILLFNLDPRSTGKTMEYALVNPAKAAFEWLECRAKLPSVLTEQEVMLEKFLNCTYVSFKNSALPGVYDEADLWAQLYVLGLKQYRYSGSDVRSSFQRRTTLIYQTAADAWYALKSDSERPCKDMSVIVYKTFDMLQSRDAHGGADWRGLMKTHRVAALGIIYTLLMHCRKAEWSEKIKVGNDHFPTLCEYAVWTWTDYWTRTLEWSPTLSATSRLPKKVPVAEQPAPFLKPNAQGLAAYTMKDEQLSLLASRNYNGKGSRAGAPGKSLLPDQNVRAAGDDYNRVRYQNAIASGERKLGDRATEDMIDYVLLDTIANFDEAVAVSLMAETQQVIGYFFSIPLKELVKGHWAKMDEAQQKAANDIIVPISDVEFKVDNWFNSLCNSVANTGIRDTLGRHWRIWDPISRASHPRGTLELIRLHMTFDWVRVDASKRQEIEDLIQGISERSMMLDSLRRMLLTHLKNNGDFNATVREAREKWKKYCEERGLRIIDDDKYGNAEGLCLCSNFPVYIDAKGLAGACVAI